MRSCAGNRERPETCRGQVLDPSKSSNSDAFISDGSEIEAFKIEAF